VVSSREPTTTGSCPDGLPERGDRPSLLGDRCLSVGFRRSGDGQQVVEPGAESSGDSFWIGHAARVVDHSRAHLAVLTEDADPEAQSSRLWNPAHHVFDLAAGNGERLTSTMRIVTRSRVGRRTSSVLRKRSKSGGLSNSEKPVIVIRLVGSSMCNLAESTGDICFVLAVVGAPFVHAGERIQPRSDLWSMLKVEDAMPLTGAYVD